MTLPGRSSFIGGGVVSHLLREPGLVIPVPDHRL